MSFKERLIEIFITYPTRASIRQSREATVPAKDGGVIKFFITLSGYPINGLSIKAL